jgi:hypothetical protein
MRYLILIAALSLIISAVRHLRQNDAPQARNDSAAAGPAAASHPHAPAATHSSAQAKAARALALAATPPATRTLEVPPPTSDVPELSDADRAEQKHIEDMFAASVRPALARCFSQKVRAHEGKLTFHYAFKSEGTSWVFAGAGDSLELIESTIPEEEDDAALGCMREAVEGAAMPMEGSRFEGSSAYSIYWSWYLS